MNLLIKITSEELGRFLLAYNRKVFAPKSLGLAFSLYYNLNDRFLKEGSKSDETTLDYIREVYTGRLD